MRISLDISHVIIAVSQTYLKSNNRDNAWPVHEILVLIAYARIPALNTNAGVKGRIAI